MNDYKEVRIDLTPCDEIRSDLLAAILADKGFESFVPDENGLTAYIRDQDFEPTMLDDVDQLLLMPTQIHTSVNHIEGRDWNSEWEKNYFRPIIIGERCVIHSSFHNDIPKCEYDIVIDPKMAFGTGHHSTTSLIVEELLKTDLTDKAVIDMGTGTGILAILAAMRGAKPITAIEIDPFAAINAHENIVLNGHAEISVIEGDANILNSLTDSCDLFLANINRNVITTDLPSYVRTMRHKARIILSGFFREDIPIVATAAEQCGLTKLCATNRENWACLILEKQ